MKLRVGLVGLGDAWETRYRPALRSLSDRFEVRAICEPVARRAELAAGEFGARPVDGYRALAVREDVDAVLFLSAKWFGVLPILAACDAGKAIYCAAAMDLALDQARNLKSRVESSGIAFMAEFPFRQAPATIRLKELIATHLGQPRLMFCHRRHKADLEKEDIRGANLRELTELVDWCCYLVGREPTSVLGTTHFVSDDAIGADYQLLSLDFSRSGSPGTGAMAQISCGRYIPRGWEEAVAFRPPAGIQVACEHGIAFVDLPSTIIWFDSAGRHMETLDSERPVGEQLLLYFHRTVTSLLLNTAGLEDAYRALSIVLESESSHRQGCRIALRLHDGNGAAGGGA
ncbi:MAG: Gfo/Idh/MocA family oxidoreductase [Pirellulales bacterium]